MKTDITLSIGPAPHTEDRRITDPNVWEGVRSQIERAVTVGHGLIKVPGVQGSVVVYVYSPTLHIAWVDNSAVEN